MKRGKLFVIAGNDASGKATQTEMLYKRLISEEFPVERSTFPRYETPTGKIIGGPLQGKPEISESYFSEGAGNVNKEVASLYYLADRVYHKSFLEKILDSGRNLILDRYVEANSMHQGGKIRDMKEREDFFKFLDKLEYGFFNLPRPDLTLVLYMPHEKGMELKSNMDVEKDDVEKDINYLKNSEKSCLHFAEFYNLPVVSCVSYNGKVKSREEIHTSVYNTFKSILNRDLL